MGDFKAYNSRGRVALLILGSVCFVVIGFWMVGLFGEATGSRRYPTPFIIAVGWFSIFFFGACTIGWLKRFFDKKVQVLINSSGIRYLPWSDQLIPWSQIMHVTTWSYKRQRSINLHLRHPESFPERGLAAKLASANRMLTGGDVAISLTGTDRKFDEAMAAIAPFHPSC